ncbi:CBS domain-containing protein [Hoeflea sp. YIM 152468]|uniref:CBS domain-containing protein n=1 Tax=Hoeflea sp. YIM 152468 TaxID=3031759 RepID=UPI0023DA3C00|nr:CBS domain-containing protein [Hoeflea sp. YIM 152468]MDF1609377.1 CBS domain-containing protein [Hoeflea sp. YIM 152468]
MRVSEVMTRDVVVAHPRDTIRQAAVTMAEIDAGVVPVGENDRLVGMLTDRDIAVRAIAGGHGPETPIEDVMSKEVKYCFEDEDVAQVLENLGNQQLRRLPVLDRDKRLAGILSLGDLATQAMDGAAGPALSDISQPGGQHSQSHTV